MTLAQDISDLPDNVVETQAGHLQCHVTLHAAAKSHQAWLETLDQRDSEDLVDTSFGNVHAGLTYLAGELGTKPSFTEVNNSLDGKSNIGHTHTIANVTGLTEQLDSKPTLVDGKLPTSYLNRVSIGETLEAANESAMLALDANLGDVAIRTDNDGLYMLKKSPATTLANWLDLGAALSGVAGVTSWNGQTGVVVAGKSDIGLGNVDNTSDTSKPVSTATQAALDAKQNTSSAVSGSANGTATALTLWHGTAAQYAAIGTKDSSTVYVVT